MVDKRRSQPKVEGEEHIAKYLRDSFIFKEKVASEGVRKIFCDRQNCIRLLIVSEPGVLDIFM